MAEDKMPFNKIVASGLLPDDITDELTFDTTITDVTEIKISAESIEGVWLIIGDTGGGVWYTFNGVSKFLIDGDMIPVISFHFTKLFMKGSGSAGTAKFGVLRRT